MSYLLSKMRLPFLGPFSSHRRVSDSRMFNRLLPYLLASLSIVFIWYILTWPSLLPIKHVKVDGRFATIERAYLGHIITPYVQNGFLKVDVHGLQQALQEIAWVESVTVRRIWPNAVNVTVNQHDIIATWGKHGLVTKTGEVIYPNRMRVAAQLPQLSGPADIQTSMITFMNNARDTFTKLPHDIIAVHVSPRYSWIVTLDNGVDIRLGRAQIEQKMARFVQAYPQIFASKSKKACYVDMRYAKGISITWETKSGCV